MLLEFGVTHVILGHSERRAYCDETDRTVNRQSANGARAGPDADRCRRRDARRARAGLTDERVIAQTRAAFDGVARERACKVAIAYEPIWAIGTGENCDPDEADRVMGAIRAGARRLTSNADSLRRQHERRSTSRLT